MERPEWLEKIVHEDLYGEDEKLPFADIEGEQVQLDLAIPVNYNNVKGILK